MVVLSARSRGLSVIDVDDGSLFLFKAGRPAYDLSYITTNRTSYIPTKRQGFDATCFPSDTCSLHVLFSRDSLEFRP